MYAISKRQRIKWSKVVLHALKAKYLSGNILDLDCFDPET